MSFLPPKPFNPTTTAVPILGASSGNPKAFQDPKSIASIGSTIQALTDQSKADRLYDAPPPQTEGFTDMPSNILPVIMIILGISLLVCSLKR